MTSVVDYHALLARTSRTFALSIPLLPEPQRRHLTLAYLLFRVADTLEDAEGKSRAERVAALSRLNEVLAVSDIRLARQAAAEWRLWKPTSHKGYLDLIDAFPELLAAVWDSGPSTRRIVLSHTRRTVDGMMDFASRAASDGSLVLDSLDSLRAYCYAVAGIVGEMITELFIDGSERLRSVEGTLRRFAPDFGEGLQLVNILKDASEDARFGRCYLPATTSRSEVFQLARNDLHHADELAALESANADPGMIAFGKLPVMLARATLDLVERQGAGSKLSRGQVAEIVLAVDPEFKLLGGVPQSLAEHCTV